MDCGRKRKTKGIKKEKTEQEVKEIERGKTGCRGGFSREEVHDHSTVDSGCH
jgi:hypothetical protein